jgi:hypothetical protein
MAASSAARHNVPGSLRQRSVDQTSCTRRLSYPQSPAPTHKRRTSLPPPASRRLLDALLAVGKPFKRPWVNLLLFCGLCYILLHSLRSETASPRMKAPGRLTKLVKRDSCTFRPSPDPLPVHHRPELMLYENGPMSSHRPLHQFADCSGRVPARFLQPAVVLLTATQNPGLHFEITLANIQQQSLQNFRWVIIDDHSTNASSIQRLRHAAKDKRIHLVQNNGSGGLAASRNLGLETIRDNDQLQAPYVVMLDDDDLFELTTLEKTVWMLESNKQWALGSYYFVKFGAQNLTETRGVHNGITNYLTVRPGYPGLLGPAEWAIRRITWQMQRLFEGRRLALASTMSISSTAAKTGTFGFAWQTAGNGAVLCRSLAFGASLWCSFHTR